MNEINDITNLAFITSTKVEDPTAKAYRLARRNGELVLQGCFQWTCGLDYGHKWRDIPIVDLDVNKAL